MGLTQKEAAQAVGFDNYQTLLSIEKGERALKALELAQFARLYERDLSYFLLPDEPSLRPAPLWRDRGPAKSALRTGQKFLRFCEDYARLETVTEGRPTQFKLQFEGRVTSLAQAVTLGETIGQRLALGSHPASGLPDALEEHGVKILILDAADAGSAASARGAFGAGVMINRRNAPWRVNYDIAHELFHLLTWSHYPPETLQADPNRMKRADSLANAFASALLLPKKSLMEEFKARKKEDKLSYLDAVNMARDFGVSRHAMVYRLINLGLISKESGKRALESDSMRHMDRAARAGDWGRFPCDYPSPRLVALAFKALQMGRLSRGRFAELMGIHRSQIDSFLAARGYNAAGDYSGEIATA